MFGGKDVENRPRRSRHRGPLLIHASAGMTAQQSIDFGRFMGERNLDLRWQESRNPYVRRGIILGVVDMVGCLDSSSSPWWMGPRGYLLENPRPFATPIPASGRLGFWRATGELEAAVAQALAE